jgi:ubiquinone/menaquinone biosynthesis C-methylase UbiE
METPIDYAKAQKNFFNGMSKLMYDTGGEHRHDSNPDYWDVLLKRLKDESNFSPDSLMLDFGCGVGRNVTNILSKFPDLFKEVHGIDISENNIKYAIHKLTGEGFTDSVNFRFFVNNGYDLEVLPSDTYSFLMSTITMQHICVYDNRFSLLSEFFRVLKPDGILSFQMGFGNSKLATSDYYENSNEVKVSNGYHDVRVTDTNFIKLDLEKIGFKDISFDIRDGYFETGHDSWVYVEARK